MGEEEEEEEETMLTALPAPSSKLTVCSRMAADRFLAMSPLRDRKKERRDEVEVEEEEEEEVEVEAGDDLFGSCDPAARAARTLHMPMTQAHAPRAAMPVARTLKSSICSECDLPETTTAERSHPLSQFRNSQFRA